MNARNVVMHCFNGKKTLIKRCIENGWFFSVPPVITRLNHFEMLVKMTPIKQLLTETDAPYLSPVAGERNEPANVLVTIKRIAAIKEITEEEVAEQIWDNASKLFF
jgi:TatD DNase family protein